MNIEQMREIAKYIRTSRFDSDDAVAAMTAALITWDHVCEDGGLSFRGRNLAGQVTTMGALRAATELVR